jgi:hypothetical protein
MGAADLLPLFTQAGVLSIFAWVLYRFFLSAVNAHAAAAKAHAAATAAEQRRADDWKAAYDAQVKRSDIKDAQIAHILAPVREAAVKRASESAESTDAL